MATLKKVSTITANLVVQAGQAANSAGLGIRALGASALAAAPAAEAGLSRAASATALGGARRGVKGAQALLWSPSQLPKTGSNGTDPAYVMIRLPSVPPELSFERVSTFNPVLTPLHPDGAVHLYQHTAPMEIAYSFELHYQDEYCVNGAVDLVRVASLLHALTLPFRFGDAPSAVAANNQNYESNQAAADEADRQARLVRAQNSVNGPVSSAFSESYSDINSEIGWPPPCVLEIFSTGAAGAGKSVKMYGYLKRASATFREPWLQVSNGGDAFNLPSGAKYDFTFVHAPTYRNQIKGNSSTSSSSVEQQAARFVRTHGQADTEWVRDNFYGTLELAKYQQLTAELGIRGLQKGGL